MANPAEIFGDVINVPAASAIPQGARVVLNSSGKAALAAANVEDDGVAQTAAGAADEVIQVRLPSSHGVHLMLCSATLAVGDTAFGTANGRIGATASGSAVVGKVFTAGTNGTLAGVIRSSQRRV
jgi:hypothetical protein